MSSAEIFPSKSLNKTLVLGTPLYHTVASLKALRQRMEFAYSREKYLDTPLLIKLPKLGVRLMFDAGGKQQLRLIEVLSFEHLKLLYKGHYLNDIVYQEPSDEELVGTEQTMAQLECKKHVLPPTLREVYNKIFGPTFPGELHALANSYILSYPGIAFRFEITLAELRNRVLSSRDKNHILSRLTNWEMASDIQCVSLAIFEGDDYPSFIKNMQEKPRLRLPDPSPRLSDLTIDNIHVTLSAGTAELTFASEPQAKKATIQIGKSTQQDILRLLGPPDSYFNKFDSRLQIHKHLQPGTKATSNGCSVNKFHNYFRHGIDFLYNLNPASGNGGVLEKIVIHNGGNIEALEFMQWNKCNWTISTDCSDDAPRVGSEMYFHEFGSDFLDTIKSDCSEPVLLNRGDSDNADEYDLEVVTSEELKHAYSTSLSELLDPKTSKSIKAWGQLRLHGYQRCIVEVNESNDCVSCVTIY